MPAFLSLSAKVSARVSARVFVRAFFMVYKVSPVAAEFYSGCGGVLFRLWRSFTPVVAEFCLCVGEYDHGRWRGYGRDAIPS